MFELAIGKTHFCTVMVNTAQGASWSTQGIIDFCTNGRQTNLSPAVYIQCFRDYMHSLKTYTAWDKIVLTWFKYIYLILLEGLNLLCHRNLEGIQVAIELCSYSPTIVGDSQWMVHRTCITAYITAYKCIILVEDSIDVIHQAVYNVLIKSFLCTWLMSSSCHVQYQ